MGWGRGLELPREGVGGGVNGSRRRSCGLHALILLPLTSDFTPRRRLGFSSIAERPGEQ